MRHVVDRYFLQFQITESPTGEPRPRSSNPFSLHCRKAHSAYLIMHEIITLQLGQRSNYLATHFWNTQVRNHCAFSVRDNPDRFRNHISHIPQSKNLLLIMIYTSGQALVRMVQKHSRQELSSMTSKGALGP